MMSDKMLVERCIGLAFEKSRSGVLYQGLNIYVYTIQYYQWRLHISYFVALICCYFFSR
jgi:hypothetical protein